MFCFFLTTVTFAHSRFTKAYLFTGLMFIGEFMCLGWYYFEKWWAARSKAASASDYAALPGGASQSAGATVAGSNGKLHSTLMAPGLDEEALSKAAESQLPKPPAWTFLVLAMTDLTSSTLAGIGQIWVSASAMQMLRGSMVLFTGICSVRSYLFFGFILLVVICF